MLQSVVDLQKFSVRSRDDASPMGKVSNVMFDDESWLIRYLVVDTGEWLAGRKVLVSSIAVGDADWTGKVWPLSITRAQVRGSPDLDTGRPVSRMQERSLIEHYGYRCYWEPTGLWADRAERFPALPAASDDEVHLRSARTFRRHTIRAADGEIGQAQGLLVDMDTWVIRFMILRTGDWWPGHEVLIAPEWIDQVSWSDAAVQVGLGREQVQCAPAFDPRTDLRRQQQTGIYAN